MGLVNSSCLQAFIITKSEEPNIKRVLDRLQWLEKVLVLDSYSTDNTVSILKSYSNVEIAYREFDTFAAQCNHGLSIINSKWVLSLDADYVLTDEFIKETQRFITLENNIFAYYAKFDFLIYGKMLSANLTTPRAVLFKHNTGYYINDGHAHRLIVNGETSFYKSRIMHDDRKSLSRWINNQDIYSIRECEKLRDVNNNKRNSFINRTRRTKILAPFFIFFYCLFIKGLIFNGWAGWYYTLQRTMVEILFSIRMIEEDKLKRYK